ncbi:MAG: glycosyltransferase family 1 protein [Anaerolineae bacterium]
MRIAIDTQSTLGRKTGIGLYTAYLLQALRDIAPEHDYVTIDQGREAVMRLDRRLRWQQFEVPRRARIHHATVLHVPGFDAPCWKTAPVVLTVHDLIGMLFPENLPPIARFYWSKWLPFSVRWADRIVADSEHTRQDIVRLLHIPADRISVVPLAAGPHYQPITSLDELQRVRQKYQLPLQFVLFVSTLEPRKGIDTLLEAVARAAQQAPELKLVITGKRGWYTERLFAQVVQLGLKERIIFTDYVPDDDLPALYGCATALVFPSRYEGFGLTVLEAMACGTPVICSNASSLPEVAGNAAWLLPPDRSGDWAQALLRLLADDPLRQQLRTQGLRRAAQFSWATTGRQMLTIYEQAAALRR